MAVVGRTPKSRGLVPKKGQEASVSVSGVGFSAATGLAAGDIRRAKRMEMRLKIRSGHHTHTHTHHTHTHIKERTKMGRTGARFQTRIPLLLFPSGAESRLIDEAPRSGI